MKTTSAKDGGGDFQEPRHQLERLLAYEDRPTAERAKRALDHVLHQPETDARAELHLWRFDELGAPELKERAAHEAASADILVVFLH